MHIKIVRDGTLSDANGTFGHLSIDGQEFCVTCEQPWNDNLEGLSCIPDGDYQLLRYDSPAHGPTVVFHNPALGIYGTPEMIPAGQTGRSLCEIHSANWPFQLKGSVGVGAALADIPPNGMGVSDSIATLHELRNRWGDRTGLTASISRISPLDVGITLKSIPDDQRHILGPIVRSVVIGHGAHNLGATAKVYTTLTPSRRARAALVFTPDGLVAKPDALGEVWPEVLGVNVTSLQHSLNSRRFDVGTVDGVFGPRTQSALVSFQKESGISVSGIADAPTWEALSVGAQLVPDLVEARTPSTNEVVTYSVEFAGPKSTVDLFFATTRCADTASPTMFTDARCDGLCFGKLSVSVPPKHKLGMVERPYITTIKWLGEDPAKHFVITKRARLDRTEFINDIEKSGQDQALVFVHGFNTKFDSAAYRMAQIVYDMQFKGVPVLFAWPSRGRVLEYMYDRDSAQFSRDGFIDLLNLLRVEAHISTVHVIAHSMGNQIVVDALSSKDALSQSIAEVILAAPDVDRDVFSLLARRITRVARRATLYASRFDRALELSRNLWDSPRAGDVPDGEPLIVPNVDTIDASAIGEEIFGLGHTTFAKDRSIIDDIGNILRRDEPPNVRTPQIRGVPEGRSPPSYWRYPD
jgi:esterase/lipase superfamily enzyme